MKNNRRLTKLHIFILAFMVIFSGCKAKAEKTGKTQSESTETAAAAVETATVVTKTKTLELGEDKLVSYDSLQTFMSPEFTAEAEETKKSTAKAAQKDADSNDASENVIPGVRNLKDYATKYTEKRGKTYASVPKIETESEEKENPNKPFIVSDWGPQGKIPSEETNPSFYVEFSQPVHALSALEEPSATSDIMSVEPELKGVFRWYGSKHLAFEAEEPADPSEVYVIKINTETKSLGGTTIKGQTTFKTKAEQLAIKNIYGGYMGKGDSAYGSVTGALPPYENVCFITLNYKTTEQRLKEVLHVKVGTKKVNYDARILLAPESEYIWGFTKESILFDAAAKKSNSFIITITDEVPHNASVSVGIDGGKKDSVYQTLKPFKLSSVNDYTDYSNGTKQNPLTISFTQTPDKSTIIDNINFDFDYKLTEDNFEINNRYLTLFNLPVNFDETHSITFEKGLKDIYGQSIQFPGNRTWTFTVKSAQSYVKFLDYGANMLEAQFPHKMIFEYQNLEPESYYRVNSTENPFDFSTAFVEDKEKPSDAIPVDISKRNLRQFQEVDFDQYLKNGYGFVKFDSIISRKYYDYWDKAWTTDSSQHTMTIQVTDLGITSRIGINKAVVMVRSLSSGKPVANADVKIINYSYKSENSSSLENNTFATGKTDENGLCVINFTEAQIQAYENNAKANYVSNVRVMVINGDDKAVYTPDSHNIWNFSNIQSGSMASVRQPKQRTFMFVDRGVYKPGETVTFRGIDMDQLLGTLKAHHGDYSYKVKGSGWDAPVIIEAVTGSLSESGGFYGSFQLPETVEPGSYQIRYSRSDSDTTKTCSFTVAEFERLKLAAEVEVPELTYFDGDRISATLSSEYLAGGVLNGADYKANWYKQGKRFESTIPETKDYSFGPYDKYSWRTYYSDETGKLSSNGTAQLKCNSEKIDDGLTYSYRVEANVTDISNQRVMAASTVTVHPALFYAGLKMADTSGFAKKNQKLQFPYVLTDVKGNKLTAEEISAKVENLNWTLKRDEWTMVHEQSVNDTVYSRYEKTVVEEASGSVLIATADGKLEITPENAGWYTLEITGKDKKGNSVITSMGFYVTGSGMGWYGNGDSENLNMTPNQSLYNPGDTAQILLQSPLQKGDYLITVEREGIFTEEIKHFDEPANVIEIPIASNYVPCVYVAVSSYSERSGAPTHEYGETDLDKPKGYFGLVRLDVNPEVRAFSVDIECDKKIYHPGEEATITLTATKGGKPVEGAELTLMAVDRGVLDLINYHVPNPIDYFYSTSNYLLCTNGGDSRSLLMDPVTYSVKNLAGGDAAAASDEEKDEDERRDYRPTAVFEPVLVTDASGKVSATFKLPDSLTTYRITAFGIKDSLFALQEEETKVQNFINVQAVQPRKLRVRDTAECGVLITNLNNEGQKVKVNLEVKTPVKNTAEDELEGRKTVPGKASVDGESSHEVYIAAGDSSVVYFDIAAEKSGTVELVYSVEAENGITDKMSSPIKIEKSYVYETTTVTGATGTDVPATAEETMIIPGFAENGHGEVSVTLDATRLGLLGTSVNYLFDYPYGCLEQQSSRILPLVLFEDYIDVFGLDSEVSDTKTVVLNSLKSWSKSQLSNGGFPYWPGDTRDSLYVSTRIAHICGAAIQRGYQEDSLGIDLDALASYIATSASKSKNDYLLAYACYVIKLMDRHNMDSVLNQLYNRREEMTLTAQAFTSLALSEDNGISSLSKADTINSNIRTYLQPVERSVTIKDTNRKDDYWWWYESPVEQMAVILQAFVKVNPEDQMVDRLLYTLLQNQKSGYWTNTATTARVLDAVYTLIKMRNLDETEFTGTAAINGNTIMTEQFSGVAAKPKTLKLPFEGEILSALNKDEAIPLTFEKDGNGNLYYTVEMKYALPDEMQSARDEGLKVNYEITDYETGEVINKPNEESSLLTLESGKLYKATVRLESTRDRTYLALRAPIPSGAEILDSTFVTVGAEAEISSSSDSWGHWLSNKYIYDNEIQFFWDNFRTGSATVTFTFRTSRRGIYPTPPVQAEAMYEPEIFGRSDGYLIVIK